MNELQTASTFDIAVSESAFTELVNFGAHLVKTGFLPKAIQNGAQAAAIILTGRELGLPPMKALRLISIVNGKPTLAAELQLGMFTKRGGHVKWVESTNTRAVLHLTSPNGDEHTETFTIEDAKTAGLVMKDVWKQYPKMMLRARCATGALRAIDPGNSLYDPEEIGGVPVLPSGDPLEGLTEIPATPPPPPEEKEISPDTPVATAPEIDEEAVKARKRSLVNAETQQELEAAFRAIDHKSLPIEEQEELVKLAKARKAILAPKTSTSPPPSGGK